jgi:trk system potassium uptake protein
VIRALRVLSGIAAIARLFSLTLLVPAVVAFSFEPWDRALPFGLQVPTSTLVFLSSFVIAALFWLPVQLATRRYAEEDLQDREAYAAVALGWLAVAALGMVPFLLSGAIPNVVDAFFESMSGITTTGASVLAAPEEVPRSIQFWRGFMQWMGGLGFVVLLVALLAGLTQGGTALMQAEAGGGHTRIRPKLQDTARALWKTYVAISGVLFLVLFLLMLRIDMGAKDAAFDALVLTFSTFSTGGFSNHSQSIAYFQDPWIEGAAVLFMILGATQFTLYLVGPRRLLRAITRNPQWRFMMAVLALATLVVASVLVYGGESLGSAVRHASFAVTTMMTGTGLAASDFGYWAQPALIVLLAMMLTGGSAGSTSGAIKAGRFVILAKAVRREMVKLLHPRAVIPIRMEKRVIREEVLNKTVVFFFSYLTIWLAGAVLITLFEPSLTALEGASASAAGIGNVGVALGSLGPSGHYGLLSVPTKLLMTALMWIGRLEIFTVLLLFYPKTWQN